MSLHNHTIAQIRPCMSREFGAYAYAFQMDSCPGMDTGLLL